MKLDSAGLMKCVLISGQFSRRVKNERMADGALLTFVALIKGGEAALSAEVWSVASGGARWRLPTCSLCCTMGFRMYGFMNLAFCELNAKLRVHQEVLESIMLDRFLGTFRNVSFRPKGVKFS